MVAPDGILRFCGEYELVLERRHAKAERLKDDGREDERGVFGDGLRVDNDFIREMGDGHIEDARDPARHVVDGDEPAGNDGRHHEDILHDADPCRGADARHCDIEVGDRRGDPDAHGVADVPADVAQDGGQPRELHLHPRQQEHDADHGDEHFQRLAPVAPTEAVRHGHGARNFAHAPDRRVHEIAYHEAEQDIAEEPQRIADALGVDGARYADHGADAVGFAYGDEKDHECAERAPRDHDVIHRIGNDAAFRHKSQYH